MFITNNYNSDEFNFSCYSWPPPLSLSGPFFYNENEYIGSGAFRAVYKARDASTNQPVVAKKFRNFNPLHERYWAEDMKASQQSQVLSQMFNQETKTDKPIRFIIPVMCNCLLNIPPPFISGEKVLIEPYLGKNVYRKFNSNSGWEDKNCGFSMGAFSHFTYHITNGSMLVCDLQGVKKNNEYILTDPVICSLSQSYGMTDLGEAGIRSFFANHDCTILCKSTWRKHSSPQKYAQVIMGTTFVIR